MVRLAPVPGGLAMPFVAVSPAMVSFESYKSETSAKS